MNNTYTRKFNGWLVQVETGIDSDQTKAGVISKKDYSASLASLFEDRMVYNSFGVCIQFPSSLVDQIEVWAESVGY